MKKERLAREPGDCDRLLFEVVESGDLEAAIELYEPNAVFVVPTCKIVTGHAAIREVLRGMMNASSKGQLEEVTSVQSDDGTIAITRAKGSSIGMGADGKPVSVEFHSMEVVRKQADGTWKIVIDDPSGQGLK